MSSNTVPTYASYNVHVKQNSLGALACFPSTLAVSGPNVLINFYIQVEGYSFPSAGAVSFEGTTTQFPGSWVVNSAHLALVDFDGVQGSDVYTLTVIDDATGQPVPIDPIIVNQG